MEQTFISKNQFDLLFDKNSSSVFYLERILDDYKIIYANKTSREYFSNHLEGKLLFEVLPKSRYKNLITNCNKAIESQKDIEYEEEVDSKIVKVTLYPSATNDKEYILTIMKELEIESEMGEKDLLLHSIFGESFLSAILLTKDGKLLKANKQFLNKFNLNLDEVKGKNFFDLPINRNDYKDDIKQIFKSAVEGNSLKLKQLTFIDHNDEIYNFNASFSPLMLTQNNLVDTVLIVMEEITQLHQQEKVIKSTTQYLQNYRMALNSAAEVTITDADGYILEVNDRFVEQSGYSREELIGRKHSILNSHYHTDDFYKNLWTTIKKGEVWRGEIRNITKYGTYFWNDCTIIPLVDENGEAQQFLSVNFNITEKKSMIRELRNIENIFKMITENTNDLIVLMNQEGIISYVSSAYERKLGYSKDELIGQFYTKLLSKESKNIWSAELSLLHYTENRKIELIHKAKNDLEFWTECNYTLVKDYIHNTGAQIIMIAREISERKEFENKLLFLAYHDALTQLPNRRYVTNEFPTIIANAKNRNESVAVLYVDGDNFKQVNDKYGHNVGDEFIYQFGRALTRSVRSHDVVARMGGDEFVVILTGLTRNEEMREKQLVQVISRLKENLRTGWEIQDHIFTPTASIGVAFYPDHGDTLMDLLENSDRALYDIKFSSKDDFKIFNNKK